MAECGCRFSRGSRPGRAVLDLDRHYLGRADAAFSKAAPQDKTLLFRRFVPVEEEASKGVRDERLPPLYSRIHHLESLEYMRMVTQYEVRTGSRCDPGEVTLSRTGPRLLLKPPVKRHDYRIGHRSRLPDCGGDSLVRRIRDSRLSL